MCGGDEYDKIDDFRTAINKTFHDVYGDVQYDDTVYYDLEIDADDVPYALELINREVAPFGFQNENPVFLIRNFIVSNIFIMKNQHIKFSDPSSSALYFNCDVESITQSVHVNDSISLLGTVEYNCFRGEAHPQINVMGVVVNDI